MTIKIFSVSAFAFDNLKKNITVSVFSNENLGMTTLVNGVVGKHKITCKFREWSNFKPGDSVNVSFTRKHFFDKETTEAISSN